MIQSTTSTSTPGGKGPKDSLSKFHYGKRFIFMYCFVPQRLPAMCLSPAAASIKADAEARLKEHEASRAQIDNVDHVFPPGSPENMELKRAILLKGNSKLAKQIIRAIKPHFP